MADEILLEKLSKIMADEPYKLVVSKPAKKTQEFLKLNIFRKQEGYQVERYTKTQVFHENLNTSELKEKLADELGVSFYQMNAWGVQFESSLMVSKKGACTLKQKPLEGVQNKPEAQTKNNRTKHYILPEGKVIPPLVDMGIFTKEGKVVASMQDKFRQINRFVEIVDDVVKNLDRNELSIVDFGCGKSYLTFILYYYFTEIKGMKVDMTGLDLKKDVIKHCNEAAARYGYTGMHFEMGDVNGYKREKPADMVITLHACDTATDYALYHAIGWQTGMIFSVPCCQHELNKQYKTEEPNILGRYGIVKERTCALMTDAIRANLLSYLGYQTQLMEFVSLDNTPKNLLIRAIAPGYLAGGSRMKPTGRQEKKEKYLKEVRDAMKEFHYDPTLYHLMEQGGYLPAEQEEEEKEA